MSGRGVTVTSFHFNFYACENPGETANLLNKKAAQQLWAAYKFIPAFIFL